MTDHELEQRLRSWYRAEVGETERAPAALRASVAGIAHRRSAPARRTPWGFSRTTSIRFAVAAAAVIGVLAVGGAFYALGTRVPADNGPSQTPGLNASPSATARAAAWTITAKMITPREDHTATLLRDGRVLVAGGATGVPGMIGGTLIASAELYDPASGTWTATGSMIDARYGHTATLLGDGRVLVAGGWGNCKAAGCEALASAELYDPRTGSWSATGSMVTPHGGGTATLLPDGKVLVAGGWGTSGVTTSAELYDPAGGTWTATGSLIDARGGHTATLLGDGRVLVAGAGYGNSSQALASAELYDPASGTWAATGSMVTPHEDPHTATLLRDGTVLVAGDGTVHVPGPCCAQPSGALPPSAELYDPASGTWTATGEMKDVRSYHTATLLPDGDVFVAGSGEGGPLPAELYDPVTRSWTAISSSIEPHLYGETATLLPDGEVLVVGGSNGTISPSGDAVMAGAELYDPGSAN